MLTVRELKPRVFEVTLAGVIEASDIETMKRTLAPALEDEGRIGLVLRMEELEDATGDALIADARFELSMLPQWSKLARVAVVTDKQAFEALFNWFDPILPAIDFRSFAPADAAQAETWAADLPRTDTAERPDGADLRIVEDGSDGLLLFEIAGRLTGEDTDRVFAAFDRAVETHGKINLMVRVKDYQGFDPGLLGDRDLIGAKFAAIGKIGRYAIVGAPGWMRTMMQALGPLMPLEMRAFDASEDAAARTWAEAG